MKTLSKLLRRLMTALSAPGTAPGMPDCLTARDWADLPVHHPQCPEA
jgi:hypothetical protein